MNSDELANNKDLVVHMERLNKQADQIIMLTEKIIELSSEYLNDV